MNIDLINKDDLEKFKNELLSDIKKMLAEELSGKNDICEYIKADRILQELDISLSKLDSLRKTGILQKYELGKGGSYFKKEDLNNAFRKA